MGIFFSLLAALFCSICNLCLRKGIDAGGSSKSYLPLQLSFSCLFMIVLNPIRAGDYDWASTPFLIGTAGGFLLGIFMLALGKTLEKGPPGLSFAFLNASSVMPAIVMAIFFGPLFGHSYTFANGIGSFLVVLGLLWAGWTSYKSPNKKIWIVFVSLIFFFQTLLLIFFQWWALILTPDAPFSSLLPFHLDSTGIQWFMPTIFLVGALVQWVNFWMRRSNNPTKIETIYGILGGITNGAGTFFLILAPQVAIDWENPMIFPIFSVGVILLCNSWAQLLYKEKINWFANLVCVIGIFIGTYNY